jgi:putative PIN family toxin of toxin-antitoxin system
MTRPRIILDTNIIVSAALQPSGLPARLLGLVAYRFVELCVSEEVLTEYREVLARPKFAGLDPQRVALLLELIGKEATLVRPTNVLKISKDDTDNRFYECAEEAEAEYLVTGNLKHFPRDHKTTKIVNARQMLELLTKREK